MSLHYRHAPSRYSTVHLAFDIFQGLGVAAAVGIRPFLPALAVGGLAAGDVEIHFKGTDLSFLQAWPFLLGLALATIALALTERRIGVEALERRNPALVLGAVSLALGALLFAGALLQGHHPGWPGLIGGAVCAAIGLGATHPLLARVRARLQQAATMLPLYAEASAVALAALSVVAPPIGPIGLLLLLWLMVAMRRRAAQKYAGLRILR